MEALSLDLRERVAAACDEGSDTQPEIAERFGVSVSFITKLLRRRRITGSVDAKPRGGGRKPALVSGLATVRQLVAEQPDATLAECATASAPAVVRRRRLDDVPALKRSGPVQKKVPSCVRAGHAAGEAAAVGVAPRSGKGHPRRLVFVDESGANTAMTRTRGRAARARGMARRGAARTLADADDAGRAAGRPGHGRHHSLAHRLRRLQGVRDGVARAGACARATWWCGTTSRRTRRGRRGGGAGRGGGADAAAALLAGLLADRAVLVQGEGMAPRRRPPLGRRVGQSGKPYAFAAVTADDARGWFDLCGYVVH